MSIDATVAGVMQAREEFKLILEPRDSRSGPAGQTLLRITNPPPDIEQLRILIGQEVWGGANQILIGQKKFASRVSYTEIELVPDWEKVVEQ